jgi:hydroxymethylglutaryl-CoA synthase
MSVGIEKVNLYAGGFRTDAVSLAIARGKDRAYAVDQVMLGERSVIPLYEDAVTLAVNAARPMLTREDAQAIELVIANTESSVDFGKPVSTWIHRFCGLPANCRSFELKHACYGGTGALKMAALWVASGVRPGKKALVVSTDFTRPHGDGIDYVGGGGAVAMLISGDPQVLSFDPAHAGYWTNEISDAFRPTSTLEVVNSQISLYSYLDSLDGAYCHYEEVVGAGDYARQFKKHIYHAPFPGMTFQAHRSLMRRFNASKATINESFQEKVAGGLSFAKRIGTAYGASNFVSLLGHLHTAEDLSPGDRISFFSYGSGCQAEFYHGTVGPSAQAYVRGLGLDKALDSRVSLSIAQHELNEALRQEYTDRPDHTPVRTGDRAYDALYEEHYAGRDRLVLKAVKDHLRTYEMS